VRAILLPPEAPIPPEPPTPAVPGPAAGPAPAEDGRAAADADVLGAARGDREAFSRLYAAHAAMVHAVLLSHAPAAEVDDLAQETFLRAWRRVGDVRDPGAFGGWLAAIARNAAADARRRARPHAPLDGDVPARAPPPSAEAREALRALRALPEAYRETLALRLVAGMTGPEIAARLGMTPGSVRVNLCRGMRLLKDRLGERRPA
jgi:RNA polymerase sigma-70 factor (ECF subfamily)